MLTSEIPAVGLAGGVGCAGSYDAICKRDQNGIFAVFDNHESLDAPVTALEALEAFIRYEAEFNVVDAMATIHDALMIGYGGKAAVGATLAHFETEEQDTRITFASAGASRLYSYVHGDGTFTQETHDESLRIGESVRPLNLLGSTGHRLKQTGSYLVPPDSTFALLTDGFTPSSDSAAVYGTIRTAMATQKQAAMYDLNLRLSREAGSKAGITLHIA